MHVEGVKEVHVVDVEATSSRSEAGVSPAVSTPSRAASADAFAARGELGVNVGHSTSLDPKLPCGDYSQCAICILIAYSLMHSGSKKRKKSIDSTYHWPASDVIGCNLCAGTDSEHLKIA
eukprot:5219403-Pleurochrysis_carterae.AAC.1